MKKVVIIAILLLFTVSLYAQEPKDYKYAIKTNVAELAVGVSNLEFELSFNEKYSVNFPLVYSPYTISSDWKLKILAFQPEFRYWLDKPMSGHFFGAHAHLGYFNVAVNSDVRYQNTCQTPLWGFGLSYGYNLPLDSHFACEFTLGAGYASISYNEYYNVEDGSMFNSGKKNYWGITRLGVSIVYVF